MIVLDASAAIEWLLQSSKAAAVEQRLFSNSLQSAAWHTPHLLDVEVAQVLRRHVAARIMTVARASEALHDLAILPLIRYPHNFLLARIWELRHNLTAYDAAYVALAEALDAPLVTCDGKIAEVRGRHARIDVV